MSWCKYGYNQLGQLKIYTRTVRSALCLPEPERVVLLFILDRTIGWRKVWDSITSGQLVSGVMRRKEGRAVVVTSGTRLTASQINETLERLLERKAIEIERFGDRADYKINENWCHPDLRGLGMWELNDSDYDPDEGADGS